MPPLLGHLRNMVAVTEMGGVIMPPVPAFYNNPRSIDDLFADSTRRILELLNLAQGTDHKEWLGLNTQPSDGPQHDA